MKYNIVFLTTIFPIKENYIYDFFDSLNNQTYKDFDVVVVNDNYKNFEKIVQKYSDLNIIAIKGDKTPAKNREKGINYCIEKGYDILIFGDIDDYFENNRVEKSIEILENYDIVVNDLILFNDKKGIYEEKYFSNRIKNKTEINFEFIKDKNIFGLSNTSMRLYNVRKFNIPDELIAVDWYIFSLLLLSNKKAVFTDETITYYRQYQENTIGLGKIDVNLLKKIIEVKIKHYKELNKFYELNKELKKLNNLKFENLQKIDKPLWWEIN